MEIVKKEIRGQLYAIRKDVWDYWERSLINRIIIYVGADGIGASVVILPDFGNASKPYYFYDKTVSDIIRIAETDISELIGMLLENGASPDLQLIQPPKIIPPIIKKKKSFIQKLFNNH